MQVGDLVILYDANSPPTKWKLGRIQETYPGKDGLMPSVLVRTETGLLKRPITKMGPTQKKRNKNALKFRNETRQLKRGKTERTASKEKHILPVL